jgi:uncharacterized protein (DUF1501 family)
MSHSHIGNRRQFLKLSAKLAALGVCSYELGGGVAFGAQAPADYKALVCIYLFGGNDSNNLIVPLDTAQNDAYNTIRGALALTGSKLTQPITAGLKSYALHYGMPEMKTHYDQGRVAFVLNTGVLSTQITKAQYQAGQSVPTNLFSHSDQTVQAQTGYPTPDGTGWGGRLLDCFGNDDSLAAVSLNSPALFLQGYNVGGNAIPPGTPLSLAGMNFWQQSDSTARKQALLDVLALDGNNTLRKTANKVFEDGLHLANTLQGGQLTGTDADFLGTGLGNQLKEVARLIQLRSQQGPGRQVFFCGLDGFDLHSGQDWTHWYLLSTLSQAVNAFQDAIGDIGLANKVTLFTQSEFSRTMQPSGNGSDHAWGAHAMVVGGAVKGGVYGQLPLFELGGPDDANTRGVWIPKIATSQIGATLGRWFGASDTDVTYAFSPQGQPTGDLGFMNAPE